MVTFFVYSAIIILLPLVPAFILYKFLPSKSTVGGPFKGLSVRLQGAFGGYFLLVLVLGGVLVGREQAESTYPRYEEWRVVGKLKFPEDVTKEDLAGLRLVLVPSRADLFATSVFPDQTQLFYAHLPVKRTGPDRWEFLYNLIVEHDKGRLESVYLQLKDMIVKTNLGDGTDKELKLKQQIKLTRSGIHPASDAAKWERREAKQ